MARQISIQDSHPIAIVKTIDSDEPERYANPSDPGIPAGDLNEDGVEDYVQVIELNKDRRNPDAPREYLTLILTYNENGETIKAVSLNGRYLPLGDINNDGIIDVGKQSEDGTIEVVNFSDTPGEFFLETDRYTLAPIDGENPIIGESVNNDFNEDGIGDALLCENSNNLYNNCLLVLGVDDPTFQLPQIPVVAFNIQAQNINFSVPPRFYTGSSIAGTGNSIYAYGYTENFSSQHFYELDLDENDDLQTVLEHEWVGTSTQALSSRRIYVADVDADNEPEIIASDDRRFPLAGFVQFFFNSPICEIHEIDFSGEEPVIQNSNVINTNCVIDRLYQDDEDDFYAGFWREGNYASCPASDFSNQCSNATFYNDDQTILPCPYESCKQPNQEPGRLLNGVADPSVQGRGLQAMKIDVTSGLIFQPLFLISEILRVAEIYKTLILTFSDPLNQVPKEVIKTAYFGGSVQEERTCESFTQPCELSNSAYYVGVRNSEGQINRETRVSGFSYQLVVAKRENDIEELSTPVIDVTIDDSKNYTPNHYRHDLSDLDKIRLKASNLEEYDTLAVTTEVNVEPLGNYDEGFNTFTVKNIGDIDGVIGEELLVGTNSMSSGGQAVNKAWIYLGENTTYQEPDYEIDFSSDSLIDGNSFISLGRVAEGLGDINGDGIGDFAVGLPFYDQRFDGVSYGAVYVFTGIDRSTAKVATDTSTFETPFLVLRPEEADYSIGSFGSEISGGDFDGDGFHDIAVLADNGSSSPVSPTIRVYKGGPEMDGIPDYFLNVTEENVGGFSSDTVNSFFDAVVHFMPREVGADHQDLYFSPGAFSKYPDAVIFKGGMDEQAKTNGLNSPSLTPAFILAEAGPTPTGSGVFTRSNPATGDLNGDGKYDVIVEKQYDGRDGAVSSRLLIFSPNSGIEPVSNEEELINPLEYRLSQNYPNPFNPATSIEFRLGDSSPVTLKVFDLLGREVATLIDNELYNRGSHQAKFDASALASGIYLYRLEAGGFIQTRKMMLIK